VVLFNIDASDVPLIDDLSVVLLAIFFSVKLLIVDLLNVVLFLNNFNNNNNHNHITHTQHASSHTHTHIDTHTNVNRLNNVSENMNFPSHAIIPSYSSQSFITSMQSPYTPSTVSQMTCTPIPSAVSNYTSRANNDVNTNIPTYTELQNIFPVKNAETSFSSCRESGSSQPGPSQLGPSQSGPSPGPSQLEPSQPGPSQPGSSQPGPSELRSTNSHEEMNMDNW